MSTTRVWVATNASDGSQVGPTVQPDPPQSWLDDSSIEDIRVEEEERLGWYVWEEINNYLENNGWSTAEINDLRSSYPTFKDYILAERFEDADVLVTEAENNDQLTAVEADDIRTIMGVPTT